MQAALVIGELGDLVAKTGVLLAQLVDNGNQRIGFFGQGAKVREHGGNGSNLARHRIIAAMKFLQWIWVACLALSTPAMAQGLLEKAQSAAQADSPREGLTRAGELQAALIAEKNAVVPGQTITVGLRLVHDPHWHTYWRNPGDSGLPTQLEWQLPPGWKAGPIQWPAPKRLAVGPLANFGYEGEVVLPVDLTVPSGLTDREVRLVAKASWLVCKDVCIPGDALLALRLPVVSDAKAQQPSMDAPRFGAARSQIPQKDGVRSPKVHLSDKTLSLTWSGTASEVAGFFYPYLEGLISPASAQRLARTAEGWRLDIALGESPAAALEAVRKSQSVEGLWAAVGQPPVAWRAQLVSTPAPAEVEVVNAGMTAAQAAPPVATSAGKWDAALWAAVGGALLGGMILNLMPCVFPVIGLKVLSFAQAAHSRTKALSQALVFSLGVVLSFIALAGLLLALRSAGEAIGWGFQLQSPWVVMLLVLLFVLIAVNLFGVFELGLLGVKAANLEFAQRAGASSGPVGSFASGVLAVVVASPCTAPFMGSAIGFTATATVAQTLVVFAALGLGMALPYIVLASWPGLLAQLPRPGAWMARFKQLMAFPMLMAASWLLWVLADLLGLGAVFSALMASVLLALVLWCYGNIQHGRAGVATWLLALAATAAMVFAVIRTTAVSPTPVSLPAATDAASSATGASTRDTAGASASHASIAWQRWAPGLAETLAAQGKTVFVDFTATWCISCQANKVRVLQTETIAKAFAERGVVALRADWTRRDADIAAELGRFGRNGVPLYLVYSKSGGPVKVLSEWLTEREVLEAIRQ